jgi:hypothetical protein
MIGGDATARFVVKTEAPLTADKHAAIQLSNDPAPVGDATAGLTMTVSGLVAACSSTNAVFGHGYPGIASSQIEIELPANGHASFGFTAGFGAYVSPTGKSLRPIVTIKNVGLGTPGWGTLTSEPGQLYVPAIPVRYNKTGVAVTLRTSPASSPRAGLQSPRKIRRGRAITISGTTSPRLAKKFLRLSVLYPGTPAKLRALARVRTDRNGRFVYRGWKPQRLGYYELFVNTPKTATTIADFRCPRSFNLVG